MWGLKRGLWKKEGRGGIKGFHFLQNSYILNIRNVIQVKVYNLIHQIQVFYKLNKYAKISIIKQIKTNEQSVILKKIHTNWDKNIVGPTINSK